MPLWHQMSVLSSCSGLIGFIRLFLRILCFRNTYYNQDLAVLGLMFAGNDLVHSFYDNRVFLYGRHISLKESAALLSPNEE